MLKHLSEYQNREVCQHLSEQIRTAGRKPIRLMEVCGTHTMAISRSGIRGMMPVTLTLLSGPGCPVCVTAQEEIDRFIRIARKKGVIVATFGDLMRVPASESSLNRERAEGADIRIVYSALDALEIARNNPSRETVFLGVGFETTAPTIAAAVMQAEKQGIANFSVISAHKRVPPALTALMENKAVKIDGFLLPGHVSAIIGAKAYVPLAEAYRIPCVVAGFEPADILQAIHMLVSQIEKQTAAVEIAYRRVVSFEGNARARDVMEQVFEPCDALWRGLGPIPRSGMKFRAEYSRFDAEKKFDLPLIPASEPAGCACGDVLTGIKQPPACALYGKRCTPSDPVGPCMVSTEGTCAAYYRYERF
ncbi:MAG: hydrogenase formation protein HypD [Desulfobacteraceae bacterium]|nr:MAG: hydrogenase formation protein HypD [Desulfobacteraceae bacterium]